MIERVARAIQDVNENTVGLTFSKLTKEMARAAIEVTLAEHIEIIRRVALDRGDEELGEIIIAALKQKEEKA